MRGRIPKKSPKKISEARKELLIDFLDPPSSNYGSRPTRAPLEIHASVMKFEKGCPRQSLNESPKEFQSLEELL